jgi:uncharacterized protein YheU (UPF0270 family)
VALHGNAAPPRPDASALSEPIVIPHAELSAEALRGVIESFVLREGTDYGEREHSLEQKVGQVRAQLERGQARILFDPETNTVTLVLVRA